jgi:hypothetical protein
MAWLQVHREYFNDTEEQHAAETSIHIKATLATYRQNLKPGERGIYDSLTDPYQDAFRICRDLARCDGPPPPPQFFLAAGELAQRIDGHGTAAARILHKLERFGIIALTEQGTKHTAGVQGRANKWKWNMSLEPFAQNPPGLSAEIGTEENAASAVDTRNDKKPEESTPPET